MNNFLIVITGYFADLIIGDPHFKYHPVKIIGNVISFFDDLLNYGHFKKIKGFITVIICCLLSYYVVGVILRLSSPIPFLNIIIPAILFYFAIANKQLIIESKSIIESLKKGLIEEARFKLGMIVGRDTDNLDENQIRKAIVETLSENLSDGVVAPLFYFFSGGLPLMYLYKTVNTLDSMLGYKNDKYAEFGFFAAKTDDLFNLIPSRLTGLLIGLVNFDISAIKFMKKFGKLHSSPNAGYPEAAIAGVLNCKLGGPSSYGGKIYDKPFIGINDTPITDEMILKAIKTNHLVTLFCLIIIIISKI